MLGARSKISESTCIGGVRGSIGKGKETVACSIGVVSKSVMGCASEYSQYLGKFGQGMRAFRPGMRAYYSNRKGQGIEKKNE